MEPQEFYDLVRSEMTAAIKKHGTPLRSRHEALAVVMEEMEEVKEAVFKNLGNKELKNELIQVAAMCFRWAMDGKL